MQSTGFGSVPSCLDFQYLILQHERRLPPLQDAAALVRALRGLLSEWSRNFERSHRTDYPHRIYGVERLRKNFASQCGFHGIMADESSTRNFGITISFLQIRCKKLPVPHAFHSSQIGPILALFKESSHNVNRRPLWTPIISALIGKTLGRDNYINTTYFSSHCRRLMCFSNNLEVEHEIGTFNKHMLVNVSSCHTLSA
jgi:hypothetical protein